MPVGSEPKERLLELRHRVAAADLAQIAAVLSGRAIREFARDGVEAIRLAQQIVQASARREREIPGTCTDGVT